MTYLEQLSVQLAAGVGQLDGSTRDRHAVWLRGCQGADGGFAGRRGRSDPYYTSFAVRALGVLGELDEQIACQVANFLRSLAHERLPPVDFFSLLSSAAILRAAHGIDLFAEAGVDARTRAEELAERLRRPDGGYAKSLEGQSSTYQTFLTLLMMQLTEAAAPDADAIARLIKSRQREDGGFVELAILRQSGTNPTAAAIGALQLLGGLEEGIGTSAAAFLRSMQAPTGGISAHVRAPMPDLLSTFSALTALTDLDAIGMLDLGAAGQFVESLERPKGGFCGGVWDDTPDVEYTFYGLGSLGLIAAAG